MELRTEAAGELALLKRRGRGVAQERALLEFETLELELPLLCVETMLELRRRMSPAANALTLQLLLLELLLVHALAQLKLLEAKSVSRRKIRARARSALDELEVERVLKLLLLQLAHCARIGACDGHLRSRQRGDRDADAERGSPPRVWVRCVRFAH